MFSIILGLCIFSAPTFEDAMLNDSVRSAVLLGFVVDRGGSYENVVPANVRHLCFTHCEYRDNQVNISLLSPFPNLRILIASGIELLEDNDFEPCESIREIILWRTSLPALSLVRYFPNLTHITLRGISLSDEDTYFIARMKEIQFLDLRYNKLESLMSFTSISSLKWLDVKGNQIIDEEIAAFRKARPDVNLLFGEFSEPDQYVRQAWINQRGNTIRKCAPEIVKLYDQSPFKGIIPFEDSEIHRRKQLQSTNEAYSVSWNAAVVYRYARLLKTLLLVQSIFLTNDTVFEHFLDDTGMPPDSNGVYPFDYVMDWIHGNKDSEILPPCLFLDDILFDKENR